MQGHQPLDLIAKHLHADRVLLVHRKDFYGIPANSEGAALKTDVVADVLHLHELAQHGVAFDFLADP